MSWLAFDIGGANLKAADGRGWAQIVPFELWKYPDRLPAALIALIECRAALPANRRHDDRRAVRLFCHEGRWRSAHRRRRGSGRRQPRRGSVSRRRSTGVDRGSTRVTALAAASNWHALARFACRFVSGKVGLLIDIGSTTTDIIPLVDGQPRPRGWNDTDRLLAGELVYTGVGRTPICAITRSLPWRGQLCPVAAELFATAADAYVILDCIPEQTDATTTADGRPLIKEFARARLARMICADSSEFRCGGRATSRRACAGGSACRTRPSPSPGHRTPRPAAAVSGHQRFRRIPGKSPGGARPSLDGILCRWANAWGRRSRFRQRPMPWPCWHPKYMSQ